MDSSRRWLVGGLVALAAMIGIGLYLSRWDEGEALAPSAVVATAPIAEARPRFKLRDPPLEPPKPPTEIAAVAEPPAGVSEPSQPERRPAPPRGKDEPPPPVPAPRVSVAKQELGQPGEPAPPPPPLPKTPAVAAPPPEPKAVKEARATPSSGAPKILGTLEPAKPPAASPAPPPQPWEALVGGDNVARVRNIMNVAQGLGSGQIIAWSNPATGATGFVTLTGWEDSSKGCARYRVTRNDTERVRWETATACR